MQTKTVHAFDQKTGLYIGPVVLDESDMSQMEPGVWHLPGNCVEAEPPVAPEGQAAFFVGGAWVLQDAPVEAPEDEAPAAEPVSAQELRHRQIRALETDAQEGMDHLARTFRYDDLADAVSFADDFHSPKYYGEGRAFRKLRGQTWQVVEPLVDKLLADESLPVPTLDELRALLPTLDLAQAALDQAAAQVSLDAIAAAAEKEAALAAAPEVPSEPAQKPKRTKKGA